MWEYTYIEAGHLPIMNNYKFYSPLISAAQRLPNGNTLVTEGSGGRIIEVTQACEIVWEYISPYFGMDNKSNHVYRAYRAPYEWVPQVKPSEEKEIPKIDITKFRVPGSIWTEDQGVIEVKGTLGFSPPQLCVEDVEDLD